MQLINSAEFSLPAATAVTIGKFDGVHLGHQKLLLTILEKKQRGLLSCVFTFDPPPAVLFGAADEKVLTLKEEKRKFFAAMGVDILIEFPLTKETAATAPGDFITQYLQKRMKAAFVAAGEDVSFGKGGRGDAALLKAMGETCGYETCIIEKVYEAETTGKALEISSSRIRGFVEAGEMEKANSLLGSPYTVSGLVVKGAHLGHTLGFPTVNLFPAPDKLLPPKGVYFSYVTHAGKTYPAITNVGKKPTVSDVNTIGIESYLYDFDEDLYGEEIAVSLLHHTRGEFRFPNVEALRAQLSSDIAEGKAYFGC